MPDKIIALARQAGREILFEDESKELAATAGIPTVATYTAATAEEALALAESIGYPVVMKVRSTAATHKSDAGGVKLNLAGAEDVRLAFLEITSQARREDPQANVTLQPMAEPGVEVIIGATADQHFGPVMMFGLGGVFTEVLDDHGFRMIPVDRTAVASLVRSLRGSRLLQGYRNMPQVDLTALEDILLAVGDFMQKNQDIAELDLNPVTVYPRGALALDARIKLKPRL
ncbi:MAG: acetate--CoA ligase family protein [Firmicutes bacterium]|nr:acetate--CoA ligase family protein [Bacillota bacterium]